MNFGIMAMQLNEIISTGNDTNLVQNELSKFQHSELIRRLAQTGFRWIEIGGDLGMFFPKAFTSEAVNQLKELKNEMGVSYTVHLPLWSIEPSTPWETVRQGSVDAVTACIQATKPLEPAVYVLHATGALAAEFYRMRLPDTVKTMILHQFQSNAANSIKKILTQTGIPSRQLAIETIEFPFNLTLDIAESLDLSVCLDTGHVLVGFSGEVDLFEVIDRCANRLAEIHLHDGPWYGKTHQIGYGKDHQALGTGDLDVHRLFEKLEQIHYNGPIIFELNIQAALDSIQFIQRVFLDSKPSVN